MKEDICPNHPTKRIPILDTEMWIEGGVIRHSHYSKPMSPSEVVLARSAMSSTSKRNILVQEGTRRLKNCHLALPWKERVVHVNSLMISMEAAGHKARFRAVVANRILANYANIVNNNSNGSKQYIEAGRRGRRRRRRKELRTKPHGSERGATQ
jgi:hypothetical protein